MTEPSGLPERRKLFDSREVEQFVQNDRQEFEHAAVDSLLRLLNAVGEKSQILRESQKLFGRYRLTFPAFHEHVRCPVFLEAAAFSKLDASLSVARLLTSFDKTEVFQAWQANREAVLEGSTACGLVFRWPRLGVKSAANAVVLHDYASDGQAPGGSFVWQSLDGTRVRLESLPSFAARVSG